MISARQKTTQQHNNTTTQQHTNTTTQQHNNTTTQQHNNTTTQQHNNTTTQQHNNTTTEEALSSLRGGRASRKRRGDDGAPILVVILRNCGWMCCGRVRTGEIVCVSVQKHKGHFFLHDRHTIFYAYYKRYQYQFDSMVSVRAFIRRPS